MAIGPATARTGRSVPVMSTAPVPIGEAGHPQRWWILVVLCLALTIIVIDNTILIVALPSIAQDLDASESTLQWVTTAYSLVLAGLLLPLAGIGDRFGRKGLLIIGLVVFGLSSVAAAWAGTAGPPRRRPRADGGRRRAAACRRPWPSSRTSSHPASGVARSPCGRASPAWRARPARSWADCC